MLVFEKVNFSKMYVGVGVLIFFLNVVIPKILAGEALLSFLTDRHLSLLKTYALIIINGLP